jgi:hypothetical protein
MPRVIYLAMDVPYPSTRELIMIERDITRIPQFLLRTLSVFLLFALFGCVGLGEQVRLMPVSNGKWQNDPANLSRDNSVICSCEDVDVVVWEIPLHGRTYSVGLILPIIPFPVGYDTTTNQPNLAIDVAVSAKNGSIALQSENLSIALDGKTYKANHMVSTPWTNRFIRYAYYFSLPKSETDYFTLHFEGGKLHNCEIPPVDFKLDKKVGLGIAAQ